MANDPEAIAWDASVFGPVTDTLGPLGKITRVTYPRFISMPNGNLVAMTDSTTVTALLGFVVGYDRVEENPPLPLFFDDFESGAPGWTNGVFTGTTDWELGTPAFGAFTNAFSGTNAWATNLDGPCNQAANPWLRSPPIDDVMVVEGGEPPPPPPPFTTSVTNFVLVDSSGANNMPPALANITDGGEASVVWSLTGPTTRNAAESNAGVNFTIVFGP